MLETLKTNYYSKYSSSVFIRFLGLGLKKNGYTLLDLSVSSLRRGHANLLCIVPYLIRWVETQIYGESTI